MRDVTSEYIEFKNDCSFLSLGDELWSGAKERWQEADEETRIAVWDRVKDWIDSISYDGYIPTMTEINDLIWFDCDDLFYPTTWTVEVWSYEEGSVTQKIEELTQTFSDRDEAVEYAESLDKDDRRVTVTNDDTKDVEEEW